MSGYPSTSNPRVARSVIDALSSELSLKFRERDPPTLDSALHAAVRLEEIYEAVAARDTNDDNGRNKKRARGVTAKTPLGLSMMRSCRCCRKYKFNWTLIGRR